MGLGSLRNFPMTVISSSISCFSISLESKVKKAYYKYFKKFVFSRKIVSEMSELFVSWTKDMYSDLTFV